VACQEKDEEEMMFRIVRTRRLRELQEKADALDRFRRGELTVVVGREPLADSRITPTPLGKAWGYDG
jgi:hypothetical protein